MSGLFFAGAGFVKKVTKVLKLNMSHEAISVHGFEEINNVRDVSWNSPTIKVGCIVRGGTPANARFVC